MNKTLRIILTYFLVSRILFFFFASIAPFLFALRSGYLGSQQISSEPYLLSIWANFDGRHFTNVATMGYKNHDFAFFPLYPIFIKFLHTILPVNVHAIGMSISVVMFLASMTMVYKIAQIDFSRHIAKITLILLAFFPLSFFYNSLYTDSLFLFVTTASFYYARKGNWVVSGIFGALATLSRFSGISLLPALGVEWYIQHKKSVKKSFTIQLYPRLSFKLKNSKEFQGVIKFFLTTGLLAIFLTGLGILLYLFYLQLFFGDWMLFQKSMSAWSQSRFVLPPQTLFRYVKILFLVDRHSLVYWIAVLEIISLFVYFALSFFVLRKVRVSYGVFMIVLLLLVSFTGTLAGTPRYMLHLFPGFIGMAVFLKDKKIAKKIVAAVFIILGFILTGLFTRGYFIA